MPTFHRQSRLPHALAKRVRLGSRKILLGLSLVMVLGTAGFAKEPFTVQRGIEMAELVPFNFSIKAAESSTELWSPDRQAFVVHTRRGDLSSGEIVDELYLFRRGDVAALLEQSPAPPAKRRLFEWHSASEHGAVRNVRWIGNGRIGFLASKTGNHLQAFLVDTASGVITQATHSKENVGEFVVSDDMILYSEILDFAPLPQSLVITEMSGELDSRERTVGQPHRGPARIIYGNIGMSQPAQTLSEIPQFSQYPGSGVFSISPSKRFALVQVPIGKAPDYWHAYRSVRSDLGYPADGQVSYHWEPKFGLAVYPGSPQAYFRRLLLVDLWTGKTKHLIDSPAGAILNVRSSEIVWTDDEKVIVGNWLLPLSDVAGVERERRTRASATVLIDPETGAYQPIFWQEGVSRDVADITALHYDADRRALTATFREGDRRYERVYRQQADKWSFQIERDIAAADLQVRRRESQSERPRIFASGGTCNCRRLLFDPALEADGYTFSTGRTIKWSDSNKTEWQGGLLLPIGYEKGKRYPLIIQTHGYSPDQFLINGPAPGGDAPPFAAQAYANCGFIVLQVGDKPAPKDHPDQEAIIHVEGYKAAIDYLDAQGLIDPTKVGLLSFSRTVMYSIEALRRYPEMLGAMAMTDGGWWSYSLYPAYVNSDTRGLSVWPPMGGVPSYKEPGKFIERSPLYKMYLSRAAVRIETNGTKTGLPQREHFAHLKYANHPVEHVIFPYGSHNLQKPMERIESQGGTLDWMRFWLQGYEDPQSGKAEKYTRWREMRKKWNREVREKD